MKLKNFDFFSPYIVALAIVIFLTMGYIGSFNYRFEYPLSIQTIGTVLVGTLVFLIGIIIVKFKFTIENHEESKTYTEINNFFSEKLLIILILLAIILQSLNMIFIGGIPLFNSVLKSNATTNIWRIAYPLFLIIINILIAKYYKKRYLILVLIGALIFGLNGYRTSVLGILASVLITMYYIGKIDKKIGILFVGLIVIGLLAIGYIASQSIAGQHWMLNPLELIFYRAGFTLEVFQRILNLGGTTHGHILSMIFSSDSPRTFIGQYVLTDNVCITSTIFGPAYLDFGLIGVLIQMFLMGIFLKMLNIVGKYKKEIGISFYSIILTHTLIWIETGPTDIMIWFLYLLGFIIIILNYKNIKLNKN
ncbi:oligosaccharide repeat unit polymerase family protein [uncultured Methanobrevibacter sp.]|uniref:oligosaccharide repeat unit polymerase family protein n=1 Tax=uncultured Methanobrevibacter sp. TaxID=253161 RepID=UPI002603FC4D|nr:oligosaccharide repeat unit polymerase family protein [uncultured Methanobrevibacter sp.]